MPIQFALAALGRVEPAHFERFAAGEFQLCVVWLVDVLMYRRHGAAYRPSPPECFEFRFVVFV